MNAPERKSLARGKLLPFSLTLFVIALDQFTKALIIRYFPQNGSYIKEVFGNDLLWITHVRNKAIAFSLGQNLTESLRPLVFVVFPIAALGFLIWYYWKSKDLSTVQRWAIAGIIGGGIGNIIDRIARPDGVVDFISVKFYGLFGLERWPTFNVADSSVVISGLILIATMFFAVPKEAPQSEAGKAGQKTPEEAQTGEP
ncbi:MAG: signal peptidase II [Spirochaetaceae bacterium]|jgi:signal peptidase II|nr:signal peptidase II [Spirochaetaceae bacterium]